MDNDIAVRPVQPKPSSVVWTAVVSPRVQVRTELPPTQVVAAVVESEPVRLEQDPQQQFIRSKLNQAIDALEGRPTTRVDQDEVTRDMVFRKLNPQTGAVVQQFPDEAVMRQRAYAVLQRRAELEQGARPAPPADANVSKLA